MRRSFVWSCLRSLEAALPARALWVLPLALSLAALPASCGDEHYLVIQSGPDGSTGGGGMDGSDGGYPGAPTPNGSIADQELDVFGAVGNRYWFAVSDEQLELMNERAGGDGPIFFQQGDIYTPGGEGEHTFVDHLWISTAGSDPEIADYGKVEVSVVGQSTQRPWTPRTIPNLNVDADEFMAGRRIGGIEHVRFNNALVGSIFRERLTLELYARLGYPAPRATYAWVSSNVWGADVKVPYVLVERYKPAFCERWSDELGGGCVNMWEFAGDFAVGGEHPIPEPLDEPLPPEQPPQQLPPSMFDSPDSCEFTECDSARVKQLEALVASTPLGEGFKAALDEWIDWPEFHRFQCLSWILATGDDALHNQNNVVLVERADGRFQYLPYSVDISLGQEWYPVVVLPGQNTVARGCQSDVSCWADTVSTCEEVIADFVDLDPRMLLDTLYDELEHEGMLRSGDEQRYELLAAWIDARVAGLADELETYREPPLVCDDGQVDCGGYCDLPWLCGGNCEPPDGVAKALDQPAAADIGAAGAGGGGAGPCPVNEAYGLD